MDGSQFEDDEMLIEKLERESFESQNEAGQPGSIPPNEKHFKDLKGRA